MYNSVKDLRAVNANIAKIQRVKDIRIACDELRAAYKTLAIQTYIIYHDNASINEVSKRFDCTAEETIAAYNEIIPFEIRRSDAVNRSDFYDRDKLTEDEAAILLTNLHRYLDSYNVTFVLFSKMTGIPKSCIQRYYNREATPSPEMAKRIADGLHMPLKTLLNDLVFDAPADDKGRYSGKRQKTRITGAGRITEAQAATLADNLLDYRHLHRLPMKDVARKTGVYVDTLRDIEHMDRLARVTTAFQIAAGLHIGADRLLNERNAFGDVERHRDRIGNERITGQK